MDAAADFFGEANVPRQAITMGVRTILQVLGRARTFCLGQTNLIPDHMPLKEQGPEFGA